MRLFTTSLSLQPNLAAPFTSFVRQRSYGYASSQELANGTHQLGFRYQEKGSK